MPLRMQSRTSGRKRRANGPLQQRRTAESFPLLSFHSSFLARATTTFNAGGFVGTPRRKHP